MDRGLFDEAVQEYARTLDASPANFRSLAQVRRMRAEDRPLIERMRAIATQPDLDAQSRAALLFGLGKAFDDLGDYGEAMRWYDAGNALRPQWTPEEREAQARRFDAVIASFDRPALERAGRLPPRPDGTGEKPIFIVGMPRSGTTLTEEILSSHPAVGSGGSSASGPVARPNGGWRRTSSRRPIRCRRRARTISPCCRGSGRAPRA